MKFGVREICDVVLKAKANQKVGNKVFYKHEPVIYFDTLKTSSMEGAATTVYAQGGRGNARLMAWEGERTVTFTMEDALISPEGFMILSGAGLIDAEEKTIYQHMTQTVDKSDILKANGAKDGNEWKDAAAMGADTIDIPLSYKAAQPDSEDYIYIFGMRDGEIISEPYIGTYKLLGTESEVDGKTVVAAGEHGFKYGIEVKAIANTTGRAEAYNPTDWATACVNFDAVLVDYYTARTEKAKQIEITADKFGGNYYLEASTLFRTQNGVDMPAEFIIPNCKIQSNFTFTMASSGDPSTFTFTMDAFPDYTRFDKSKKVLAAIQIIEDPGSDEGIDGIREFTAWNSKA